MCNMLVLYPQHVTYRVDMSSYCLGPLVQIRQSSWFPTVLYPCSDQRWRFSNDLIRFVIISPGNSWSRGQTASRRYQANTTWYLTKYGLRYTQEMARFGDISRNECYTGVKPSYVKQMLVNRHEPNNSEATNQQTNACILDLEQWLQNLSNKPLINQIVEIFRCFV